MLKYQHAIFSVKWPSFYWSYLFVCLGMDQEVDSANNMVAPEYNSGGLSRANPKRLRSKAWEDFTPIFVGGKVAKAECMHCHQVFNSNSSSGTSNLLKHQAMCAPRAQKRPMQRKLMSAGSDPTQKKLSFFPTSQKKCVGTSDARPEKKDLVLLCNDRSKESSQNGSHEELGSPEQNDLALPDVPTDTKTKSQQVDQNGSHDKLGTTEQENDAFPDNPIDKNVKNQSHEELALPEQKGIPTATKQKNQDVGQDGSHGELVRKLSLHGYLPSMMDHGGLRKSVDFLNPMAKMPSYADLISAFLDLFDNEKAKLKEKFAAFCSRVCLSVHVWHYDPLSAFLCLSVHYIDDEWERQQKIITFHAMDDTICIAEELGDAILLAIRDWGLCGKVFSIILDDAFIDDSVASSIKAQLMKENSTCANQSLFVVRYGTHLLDQVIQVGLDEFEKIMEKSANCSKSMMGPNSCTAVRYPNYQYAPSQEDWGEASKMCETLEEFHQHMDTIQHFRGPVHLFNSIEDVKRDLRHGLEGHQDGSFSNMLKKMQQKFQKHWKLCCLHLCMQIVMDPSDGLEHIKSKSYVNDVHDTLLNLFYEYSGQVEDPSCTSGSKTSKEAAVNEDDMPLACCGHYGDKCSRGRPMTELDQYFHEPTYYCRGQTSVLQWWKEHNLTYPTVARMARDILAYHPEAITR
uniref:BED-type domain-containing protein n=2 Tax=Hordeum vulgare subsp. vulgare TaxID=112509 RepID=A0A8I6XQ29_HORVV